ncbi:MAG: hypothetical protein KIT84_19740 [Labilithrix sp.]|nr:hypothetical protein [Labilithrix sp.]MCW5813270.1 hypothetical protein [Labilithrix sp.]
MNGEEAVYEMLWDCKYCGQKKLLGVTHRFCAGCGAPQDPNARYFPPDHEKVAVKNHPYVGADVVCPSCRQPMSRAAKCCTNCGGPIDKGAEVARQADVVVPPPGGYPPGAYPAGAHAPGAHAPGAYPPGAHAPGAYPHGAYPPGAHAPGAYPQQPFRSAAQGFQPAPPKKSSAGLILGIVGGVFALLLVLVLVAVFWKREAALAVTGHSWERSIRIERFENVRKSTWCDEIPAGARVVSRRREQRGTKREKDGQTCSTRKKDLGNGSYKEVRECTDKYKETPVYDDKCDIDVTEWRTARTATEKGASVSDTPRWPVTKVTGGTCLGCEREGSKTEKYTVLFTDAKSKDAASCDLPQAKWSTFKVGSKWKGQVRVMTGGVDCNDLIAQ